MKPSIEKHRTFVQKTLMMVITRQWTAENLKMFQQWLFCIFHSTTMTRIKCHLIW